MRRRGAVTCVRRPLTTAGCGCGAVLGHGLEDYANSLRISVPPIVLGSILEIELGSRPFGDKRVPIIGTEGIYRHSGNQERVKALIKRWSALNDPVFKPLDLSNEEPATITSCLRLYFRELETPLIPSEFYPKLYDADRALLAVAR